MRLPFAIFLATIVFVRCSDENANDSATYGDPLREDSIRNIEQPSQSKTNIKEYELNQMIGVDLDGDGDFDYVQFNRAEGKILIGFGGDSTRQEMSFETEGGEKVSDFSWVDSWGLISGKSTPATYVVNGELRDSTFTLENPAIQLWQDGGGSGFFTFKGGKFVWIASGC